MTNPNSFENLTQSGLLKVSGKEDRNMSLQLDVWNGSTSFAIFTQGGGKPWKLAIPTQTIAAILILLRKMRANPAPCREAIFVNEYDAENKRMKQVGQIGIGIDESLLFQIDFAHNQLQVAGGKATFAFKPNSRFDFSHSSLTDKEKLQACIDEVIAALALASPIAARISSFKRQAGQAGGGNRGGFSGGGNRNFNNNSGGGYNRNNNQAPASGGTFGGDVDIESDLHV